LIYSYTNAAKTNTQGARVFQVIRVPQYTTATLSAGLAALAWNGTTGGVLAIDVRDTLTLGGVAVNVNGLGFRGGGGLMLSGSAGRANTDFQNASPGAITGAGAHGSKGEGIAGTPSWVDNGTTAVAGGSYPSGAAADGSMARGAPGNAGGGGTDANPVSNNQNSGGGGGANGGAVCVNFFSGFLDGAHYQALLQYLPQIKNMTVDQSQRFLRTKSLPPVSLARIADHIDHVVKVAGAEHACLGSDFDGIPTIPAGMEDASKLPWLTAELRRRGYTPDQLDNILGGNVLRVLEANERGVAARSQAGATARSEGRTVSDIR